MANKSKHDKSQSKHDDIVKYLEERLSENSNYTDIRTHYYYETKRYAGELDILLYNNRSGNFHYYEVKCSYSRKNYERAKEQFERVKKAFPNTSFRGIYVSENYVGEIK